MRLRSSITFNLIGYLVAVSVAPLLVFGVTSYGLGRRAIVRVSAARGRVRGEINAGAGGEPGNERRRHVELSGIGHVVAELPEIPDRRPRQ